MPLYDNFQTRYSGFSESSYGDHSQTKVIAGGVAYCAVLSKMHICSTHTQEKGTRTHLSSSHRAVYVN